MDTWFVKEKVIQEKVLRVLRVTKKVCREIHL